MRMNTARAAKKQGFSSIELVVVLAIFGVLSGVVLFRFSDFNANVSLNNLAHDVALYAKKAQTDATSGRRVAAAVPGAAAPSYGVRFERATGDRFQYFRDANNNGLYASSEELENVVIQSRDRITELWVLGSGYTRVDGSVHITFTRPYLEANIRSQTPNLSNITRAFIVMTAASGKQKTVVVHKSGQIEVVDGVPAELSSPSQQL